MVRRAKARSRAVLGPLGFGGIGGMYGLTQVCVKCGDGDGLDGAGAERGS